MHGASADDTSPRALFFPNAGRDQAHCTHPTERHRRNRGTGTREALADNNRGCGRSVRLDNPKMTHGNPTEFTIIATASAPL